MVAGNVDDAIHTGLIKKDNGTAVVKKVIGQELKASSKGGKVIITDAKGGKATVVDADLKARNGVVYVTEIVSFPK